MKKLDVRKLPCPICGQATEFIDIEAHSTAGALGGYSRSTYYKCTLSTPACEMSTDIYHTFTRVHKRRMFDLIMHGGGWRKALNRYNKYCEFITDSDLKGKLHALADDYLNVDRDKCDHLYENG